MKLMPSIFDDVDKSNWRDASYWLGYTLIGGLAPIWSGYIILRILSQDPTWTQFSEHGEFALYTAALVAPAFHTVSREFRVPGLRGRQFFLLASFCCMFLAVFAYVAVGSAYASNPSSIIDQAFLAWLTLGIFVLSTVLALCVTVLDYARLSSDLPEVVAGQRQNLKREFDDLQEKP